MVRVLGTILQKKKKIYIALTAIYGIGIAKAQKILNKININPNIKVSDLTDNNIFDIRNTLEQDHYQLSSELKHIINLNIKHLININSYKGKRHLLGLPVNGQRTRTNSRTSRKLNVLVSKK